MTYAVLLAIYRIWLGVGVLLILCSVSSALFSRDRTNRGRNALRALPMAILWPLATLSQEGRRALRSIFPTQW